MLTLTSIDHDRNSAGLTYVYPVLSRRAGGVSVGINLNPNNACNWRCLYCQVPDLKRGAAPEIDLPLLEHELRHFLSDALEGGFYDRYQVPEAERNLRDISLSGNGEATSCAAFSQVIELIGKITRSIGLADKIKLVVISNGSLIHQPQVQQGLKQLADLGGELWFKLDGGSNQAIQRINQARFSIDRAMRNLKLAAALCPVWIQSCMFQLDGQPLSTDERQAYIDRLATLVKEKTVLRGVLLYSLARPSMQPEAERLIPVSAEWLEQLAEDLRSLGLTVKVSL